MKKLILFIAPHIITFSLQAADLAGLPRCWMPRCLTPEPGAEPAAKRQKLAGPNLPITLRNRECGRFNTADQELLFRLIHPDKPAIDDLFDSMHANYSHSSYLLAEAQKLITPILRLPTYFLRGYLKTPEGGPQTRPTCIYVNSRLLDFSEPRQKICDIFINHLLEDDTIPERLPKLLTCLCALPWGRDRLASIKRINRKINTEGKHPELMTIEKEWETDFERFDFKNRYSYYARALAQRMRGDYSNKIKFSGGHDTLERRHSTSW